MAKAEFQMSLGFIVGVVFAIVLLSLAIVWLRSTIESITKLTIDLTQQAHSELRNTFTQTNSKFAIYPNLYDLDPGTELKMSAGIENQDPDGRNLLFVINVIPASASNEVMVSRCPGQDPDQRSVCPTLRDEMERWLTFDASATRIEANTWAPKAMGIKPANNAVLGTYIFNVVACSAPENSVAPSSATCLGTSQNSWGNPQPLQITVK